MNPSQYYIETLTAAFKNLGPIVLFIIGGYLVFIKLPFLFFLKSMREERIPQNDFRVGNDFREKDYKLEDYLDFQRRMKIIGNPKAEPVKEETRKAEPKKEEQKKAEPKAEKKTHRQEESKQEKKPRPKARPLDLSAEQLFDLQPGISFSKSDLKKKYHELLKMNHPDKFASQGMDLKKQAEKKTKEINSAYVKLKSRAA